MQLIKCAIDGVRPQEKPVTIFWAWRDQEGTRHAYRQRLCIEHYTTNVLALEAYHPAERLTCPACGIDVEDSYIPIYATVYMPGAGRINLELPLCDPCSVRVRVNAEVGSESLPDRSLGVSDATPKPTAWETLRALGRA